MRQVVDDPVEQQTFFQQLHNKSGHKRQESTYQRVADRYWWDNLHVEVKSYVHKCEKSQRRDPS